MKWYSLLYSTLIISLTGCQNFPVLYPAEKVQITSQNLDQLSEYGAKFAYEYSGAAEETCTKYTKLYQEGDWRAGWILALQVTKTKSKHCLNSEQAVQALTTLETENKINPELLWLTHIHLSWLAQLEQQAKKVRYLKRTISRRKSQVIELEEKNQELVQKLEALKAIETSINQQLNNE